MTEEQPDKVFEIKQYQLYTETFLVKAKTACEAVIKIVTGKEDGVTVLALDESLTYEECDEDHGMDLTDPSLSTADHDAISEAGVPCNEFVPSIKSVRELNAEELAAYQLDTSG